MPLLLPLLALLQACDPPETISPLPPGVPRDAGSALSGPGPAAGKPAGASALGSSARPEPTWKRVGAVPVTGSLTLTGPMTASCCTGDDEVEGAPLRFFLSPAEPGQRDGYVLVVGKGDLPALLQQSERGKYGRELWRGTTPVVPKDGIGRVEVPGASLPQMALKLWPGSAGTVTVGGQEIQQSAEGAEIPFVLVLPAGTTEPAGVGAPPAPGAGGDPALDPPPGEAVGAFEKSPPKVAGDPKTAPPPGAKVGETPIPGGEAPTPPPDPKK